MSLQLLDELPQRKRSPCVCFHVGHLLKPSPHSSEGVDWTEVRSAEKLECRHLFLQQAEGRGLSIPALRMPGSDCCREGHRLLQNQPEPHCSLQCTWPSSGWGNLKLFLAAMTKLKTCCSSGPYRASWILQEEQAAVSLEVFRLFYLSHHCNTPCTRIRQVKYQQAAGSVHPRGPVLEQRFFSKMSGFLIFPLYLNVWDCLCCKAVKLFMTVDLLRLKLYFFFFFTCLPSHGSFFINFQCHSKSAITYPQRAAHTWPLS